MRRALRAGVSLVVLLASAVLSQVDGAAAISDRATDCDVSMPQQTATVAAPSANNDSNHPLEFRTAPLDLFEIDLLSELPCDFANLFVTPSGTIETFLTSDSGATTEIVNRLSKKHGIGNVAVRRARQSRSLAEETQRSVSAVTHARRAESWIAADGVVNVTVYGTPLGEQAALREAIERTARVPRGVVATAVESESPFVSTATLNDWHLERGGNYRRIGDASACTSGPQLYNSAYGWFGTVAGHCGNTGALVEDASNTNVIDQIRGNWGWSSGTYNADVGTYVRVAAAITGTFYVNSSANNVYGMANFGTTAGPQLGYSLCWTGVSSGLKCATVTKRSVTSYLSNDRAFRYTYELDKPSSGGDSGGPSFDPLANLRATVYGTALSTFTNASRYSNIAYLGQQTNSAVVSCGC